MRRLRAWSVVVLVVCASSSAACRRQVTEARADDAAPAEHPPSPPSPIVRSATPERVPLSRPARGIALGTRQGFAIDEDGAVLHWGVARYAYRDDMPPPEPLVDVVPRAIQADGGFVQLAADDWACGLRGGAVSCFGHVEGDGYLGWVTNTDEGAIAPLAGAAIVHATARTGCAVVQDGGLWCWIERSTDWPGPIPRPRPRGAAPTRIAVPGKIVALRGAGGALYAILDDGRVAGLREPFRPCVPGASCGASSTCAKTGACGAPALVVLPGLTEVVDVAGEHRHRHACAVRRDGAVVCFGKNEHGALGDGTTSDREVPAPVVDLPEAARVACGLSHACALLRDGTVRCWGDARDGQLGDGSYERRLRATPVSGLADVVEIAAHDRHSCARKKDGSVWCWGANTAGELAQPILAGDAG